MVTTRTHGKAGRKESTPNKSKRTLSKTSKKSRKSTESSANCKKLKDQAREIQELRAKLELLLQKDDSDHAV